MKRLDKAQRKLMAARGRLLAVYALTEDAETPEELARCFKLYELAAVDADEAMRDCKMASHLVIKEMSK